MDLEKYDIFFIIGIVAAAIFMIFEVIFQFVPLNFTFLVFFWSAKFLAGFGLIISIGNGILWILNRFTEQFGEKEVRYLVIFQLIIPGILIGYAIYTIFANLPGSSTPQTPQSFRYWLDLILYVYGILSLIIQLYILPLFREEFQETVDRGTISKIKSGAKKVGRGVKKRYFSWRGKYAKVQIQDQMTINEVLEIWRNRFAVYLLLPIAIGSLFFTPIAFICVLFLLKVLVLDIGDPKPYERIGLLISMAFIAAMAVLSYIFDWIFYSAIAHQFWTIQIFYLIGIVVSTIIFIYRFIQLKGFTIKKVREAIEERRAPKEEAEEEKIEEKSEVETESETESE
jgi:MFS family permease